MAKVLKKKVVAITIATVALTTSVVHSTGADKELSSYDYYDFIDDYAIQEFGDKYNVYKTNNSSQEFINSFNSFEAAADYVYEEAERNYENQKDFNEDIRKIYIGTVAGLSALISTTAVNMVPIKEKRKRR